MQNSKTMLSILSLCTMCLLSGAYAQITPSADAYTNTAAASTNYGANVRSTWMAHGERLTSNLIWRRFRPAPVSVKPRSNSMSMA